VYISKILQELQDEERSRIYKLVFSWKIFDAIYEIFLQCLVHQRIWKKNRLAGYMHMSFALGWFLLIVFGNFESRYISNGHINPPYFPIFLKFFIHDREKLYFEFTSVPGFFRFVMDFLLLFVLSGLFLAIIKRIKSQWFGFRVKPQHGLMDKVAMTSLWLIFPFRLLAESFTAGMRDGGGGFFTGGLGYFFKEIMNLPLQYMAYPAWWAYSLSLGFFFVSMPWSRYMHIPTEALFILLKKADITINRQNHPMQRLSLLACSSCGMCTNVCQLRNQAMIHDSGSARFVAAFRFNKMNEELADKCLMCLRCSEICPVALPLEQLRYSARTLQKKQTFYTIQKQPLQENALAKGTVLYYAGCMTSLQPSVIASVKYIFMQLGLQFKHVDEAKHLCCGRPALLAGFSQKAEQMREVLLSAIHQSEGSCLVVSCPICLNTLTRDYSLNIPVIHHTEFISKYISALNLGFSSEVFFYHDPCELGRGLGIYKEPRSILSKIGSLAQVSDERSDALCCGGSLAALSVPAESLKKITYQTLQKIPSQVDYLVTACPRCKNTFATLSQVPVKDIAEIVAGAIPKDFSLFDQLNSQQNHSTPLVPIQRDA
jgi:Fe-S oxidoreductase